MCQIESKVTFKGYLLKTALAVFIRNNFYNEKTA